MSDQAAIVATTTKTTFRRECTVKAVISANPARIWRLLTDAGDVVLKRGGRALGSASGDPYGFLLDRSFDPWTTASVSFCSMSAVLAVSRSSVFSFLVDLSTNSMAE